jgi:hypothetical protein
MGLLYLYVLVVKLVTAYFERVGDFKVFGTKPKESKFYL